MCNVCCKEFGRWCKAFTKTEVYLAILELILFIVFIVFLVFVILHLVSCASSVDTEDNILTFDAPVSEKLVTDIPHHSLHPLGPENNSTNLAIACTWKFSQQTVASTHYYEVNNSTQSYSSQARIVPPTVEHGSSPQPAPGGDAWLVEEESDGEVADEIYKRFIMALVKFDPPHDLTFGCILTVVSEYWTLTAASCIESIEEIDSLDSFVMSDNYGEREFGKTHVVSDVRVHPQYQRANGSFDIVALKSGDSLFGAKIAVQLADMVDYSLVTLGERLTLLGFGKFRSVGAGFRARGLRAVQVHVVSSGQCDGEGRAPRHLCAAVLASRTTPCGYCAGAPLLSTLRRALLAVMASAAQCGLACEPAPYVNVAALSDWLDSLLAEPTS